MRLFILGMSGFLATLVGGTAALEGLSPPATALHAGGVAAPLDAHCAGLPSGPLVQSFDLSMDESGASVRLGVVRQGDAPWGAYRLKAKARVTRDKSIPVGTFTSGILTLAEGVERTEVTLSLGQLPDGVYGVDVFTAASGEDPVRLKSHGAWVVQDGSASAVERADEPDMEAFED